MHQRTLSFCPFHCLLQRFEQDEKLSEFSGYPSFQNGWCQHLWNTCRYLGVYIQPCYTISVPFWNIACCPEAVLKCCVVVFLEDVLLTLFLFVCLSLPHKHTHSADCPHQPQFLLSCLGEENSTF